MNTAAERAQSYAKAFFEAAFERWLGVLDNVAQKLAGNPPLLANLQSAEVNFAERQIALTSFLPADTDPLVRNLLYTLLLNGELNLLPDIVSALRARGTAEVSVPVEVVTALPLEDQQRQALEEKLAAQYGAGLSFSYRVDPAILGGIIVRVGDKLIDSSLASKLAAMRQALGVAVAE